MTALIWRCAVCGRPEPAMTADDDGPGPCVCGAQGDPAVSHRTRQGRGAMNGETKEMSLAPVDMSTELVRLASDPNFNPATLQALIAMHERSGALIAVQHFNAAMSAAQAAMRHVAADASNPQTKSRYASYAAIDKALRPIYTTNGFALSFDTDESPIAQHVRVLCYLTHAAGHVKTYHVDMPADGKGAKGGDVMTLTHAAGAAMSYGMRYLVKMIFNVAVGEEDRDGNEAPQKSTPIAPARYDEVFMDLAAVADEGTPQLHAAWKALKDEYRRHISFVDAEKWEALKARAAKVTAAQKASATR